MDRRSHLHFRGNGFTLIEVLVAMVILAFLALFTSQSIQRAIRAKAKVQTQADKSATLRDALKVMERDINMAFNYRDVAIQVFNLAQQERRKSQSQKQADPCAPYKDTNAYEDCKKKNQPDPGGAGIGTSGGTPPPQATPDENELKLKTDPYQSFFKFWGERDNINFSSLSNIRMTEDAQMDTQAEIGYFLKACRRRSTQEQSSQCLWRRVSSIIDKDIDKDGEETVLLENVEKFELKYLGPGKDEDWVDQWLTGEKGDDKTRNNFPLAVEITLGVRDPNKENDKLLVMTTVAAIRNPNNPTPGEAPNPSGSSASGGSGGGSPDE